MTVSYTGSVANCRLAGFSRLLLCWKGSIYKLVYKEMLIFITLYTTFSLLYRLAMKEWQKRLFERIVLYCHTFTELIPLSFILGFYVAIVVARWWNQYLNIPWPDRVMMYVSTLIEGNDDRSRMIRRTLMRYLTLASLLVLRQTSVSVKKRFPTNDHLIEAGIMTPDENKAYEEVNTPHGRWWLPIVWSFNIVKQARNEDRILNNYLMKTLLDEIQTYRSMLGMLLGYDWISIPLVYTQVTTLAVYTFFLGMLFGRQFLDPAQGIESHEVDIYVPFFTILQFFFYMGWLKVAEQMINPFGEDDDDFDMNWIVDRNMQVSLLAVDDLHQHFPKLEKDLYWDEPAPDFLPYTEAAIGSITKPFKGSTANLSVSDEGMQLVNPMETIQEGEIADDIPTSISHTHLQQTPIHSPISSPRQIPNPRKNLLVNRLHLSLSKSTIHSSNAALKSSEQKNIFQNLTGSSISRAHTYIDHFLHDSTSRLAGSKSDIAVIPNPRMAAYTNQPRLYSQSHLRNANSNLELDSPMSFSQSSTLQDIPSTVSERFHVEPQPDPIYTSSSIAEDYIRSISQPISIPIPSRDHNDCIITVESEKPSTEVAGTPAVDASNTLPEVNIPTESPDNALRDSCESIEEGAVSSTQSTVNSLTPLLNLKDTSDA